MIKKIATSVMLLLVLVFTTSYIASGYKHKQGYFTIELAAKIQPGMTEAEVIKIMGKKPGDYSNCSVITWSYSVLDPLGRTENWCDNTTRIIVSFNELNCVSHVFVHCETRIPDIDSEPSPWDRIVSLFQ